MSLPKPVYKMLEDIVGPEYISDRPYILAAYRHKMPNALQKPVSPEAVLLPGNSKEIQAIVKVCNEHNIKYIPVVSMLTSFAYPTQPGTIILHLKRMNRIVEINEKDRYAIIEPGVRHGQLRTELMKRGLSYPVAAVGPAGSVLASFACASGDNHIQYGSSRTNRYIGAFEWILPTGELIKIGSLATESGWFCGDGPGPSLRGLIKGYTGQWGNLGIITKLAINLDPWKGPEEITVEGHSPTYKIQFPRDCHKIFIFKFPTLENLRDAIIKIGKAEIGYAVQKYFNATAALLVTESANDFWDLWNSGLFQRELSKALYVYLATWSSQEMEYEEKILKEIIEETGGEEVAESIKRLYEDNMDFYVLVSFVQRVLRLGGGWAPVKLSADSVCHMFEVCKAIPEFLHKYIDHGLILDAPDNFQIVPMEYGHMAHIELLFIYDSGLCNSAEIASSLIRDSATTDIKHGYHAAMPSRLMIDKDGPLYSNYHIWAKKIKEALDPKRVSNPLEL